jgi:hypothetical protein
VCVCVCVCVFRGRSVVVGSDVGQEEEKGTCPCH